jgi:hypothetical protein
LRARVIQSNNARTAGRKIIAYVDVSGVIALCARGRAGEREQAAANKVVFAQVPIEGVRRKTPFAVVNYLRKTSTGVDYFVQQQHLMVLGAVLFSYHRRQIDLARQPR